MTRQQIQNHLQTVNTKHQLMRAEIEQLAAVIWIRFDEAAHREQATALASKRMRQNKELSRIKADLSDLLDVIDPRE